MHYKCTIFAEADSRAGQQVEVLRFGDGRAPRIDLQFLIDVQGVLRDRVRTDEQARGDFFVAQALLQQSEDFKLTLGQRLDQIGRPGRGRRRDQTGWIKRGQNLRHK
jgi:hypothetical protein